jgi:hypothetical protein
VLRQRCLFGGLTLALGRVAVSTPEPAGRIEWLGLRGLEALRLSGVERGEGESVSLEAAGKLCFVGPGVGLHPLAIYREDAWGRHQVGFLNRAVLRRHHTAGGEEVEEVQACQYLDYASGAMPGVEARAELTRLLGRLRGRVVTGLRSRPT